MKLIKIKFANGYKPITGMNTCRLGWDTKYAVNKVVQAITSESGESLGYWLITNIVRVERFVDASMHDIKNNHAVSTARPHPTPKIKLSTILRDCYGDRFDPYVPVSFIYLEEVEDPEYVIATQEMFDWWDVFAPSLRDRF
jgi:hypothetical protein